MRNITGDNYVYHFYNFKYFSLFMLVFTYSRVSKYPLNNIVCKAR